MKNKSLSVIILLTAVSLSAARAQEHAQLASIYYWKAKPGKVAEYNRYITSVAEPIDEEARRAGAFISVTTFMTGEDSSAWTHMRVFLLRDTVQLQNLARLLDEATIRLEPDENKRKRRSEYTATIRDFVAHQIVKTLN